VKPDDGYELKLTDQEMLALLQDRYRRDIVQPKEAAPSAEGKPSPPSEGASEQKDAPKPPDDQEAPKPEASKFVDPQLRMAIDYLSGELARAH